MATNRVWLICAAVSGALLLGCNPPEAPVVETLPRVKAFTVGEETAGQVRRISGQVAAATRSELSFGVAGTVDRVLASTGTEVVEDQLLATLDPEPLRIALGQARARLAGARANLVEAEQSHERAAGLLSDRAGSQADFEVAVAKLKFAKATLQESQSDVERRERDLRLAELRAPFAGRVAARPMQAFQEIGANEPAFILQTADTLVVKLRVPEALIRYVDYAQRVPVTFPTIDGLDLTGVVSLIGAQGDVGSSFPVEIRLPTSEADLRPGMTANVTFNFGAYADGRTIYLIPLSCLAIDSAVLAADDLADAEVPVLVFDEATSRLQTRLVRIGGLRGSQLEVLDGLEAGERVIDAGVPFLREGMEVELWAPTQGLSLG